jgi:hypothetical protein
MPYFVGLAGEIGAGKTTLAEERARRYGSSSSRGYVASTRRSRPSVPPSGGRSGGDTIMEQTFMERIDQPWGYERIWAHMADYAGKVLHVNRGHKWSRQGQTQHIPLGHRQGLA